MATPENLVKKKVKKLLDEFGCWHCSPVGGALGRAGIPDILTCIPSQCGHGLFLAIECKAGTNWTTKIQEYELGRIRRAGGCTVIINENGLLMFHEWLANTTGRAEKLANGTAN